MQQAVPTEAPAPGEPAAPVPPVGCTEGGWSYRWGLQAVIDMYMSKRMIAGKGGSLVQRTFMPMIRLAADDPTDVDRAYAEIRSRRETIRLLDSPRERWRKRYGNFVREVEWALLELRKQFTQAQYEEVVIETAAALARLDSQREIDFLNGRVRKAQVERENGPGRRPAEPAPPATPTAPTGLKARLLKIFDPGRFAAFLVGESEITEIDPATGSAVMEVPNCAWHTCPAPDSLPRPGALPEQGCLLICKGLFERIFDGREGIKMQFDPHLPETSCTIRIGF